MTKEEIAKKINNYTNKKIMIASFLLISSILLCICVIFTQFVKIEWVTNLGIGSYISTIVMMIIACRFNLNELLMKVISIDDYKELLKYMSEIPNDISAQKYYDGLLMIKRSLNEMVYYRMNGVDENFRKHLCYLQSMFLNDDNNSLLSPKVLNKTYLKNICNILLQQINNGQFKQGQLDSVAFENETIKKQFHITVKMITNLFNAVLIIIVIAKIGITIDDYWYNNVNSNLFLRVMYNTSIDFIAACLAIIAWREK